MSVKHDLSFELIEQQYSSDGNKSIVRFTWLSTQDGDSYNNYTRTASYTVTQRDGSSETYSVSYTLPKNSTTTIVSTNLVVDHNSSGYGSITVQTWMDTGISAGVIQKSASFTAPRIEPLSTVYVHDGTLGVAQNIIAYKASNHVTHTITYTCGSASGTICTKSKQEEFSWTPPLSLAEQAPSGISVPVEFTIINYEGDEKIGKQIKTITCAIPETSDFIPVLIFASEDAMGYASTYGAFVQGQSKLKLDITTYGAYGAWIVACKTIFDGVAYTGTDVTSNPIVNYGELPVKVIVTDSRARVTEVNTTITVLPYRFPKIHSLTAARCNQDGSANSSGGYIKASFSAEVASLNSMNTARYWIGYRPKGGIKEAVELTAHSGKYSVVDSYIFAANASSHDVIFTIQDGFKKITQTIAGASVKKMVSMLKENDEIVGMALNKVAEEKGVFDIGFKSKFSGGIASKVLPNGTDFNTVIDGGFYFVDGASHTYYNVPHNKLLYGYLEVFTASEGNTTYPSMQRFTQIIDPYASGVTVIPAVQYHRLRDINGNWKAWKVEDIIIDHGESDGWAYRKWYSGKAECWKTLTHTTTVATSWNSMYVGNATQRQNYPFSFIEKPVEIVTITSGEKMGFIYPEQSGHGVNGASASARYNVASLSSITTNATFYFNFYVTGKWR